MPEKEPDYRELLRRYIDLVGDCEGITYLSDTFRHDLAKRFTPEEIEILRGLE